MSGYSSNVIAFSNGFKALSVSAKVDVHIKQVIDELELRQPDGLLLLVGDAGNMDQRFYDQMQSVFNVIANFVNENRLMVVDGGIDAGLVAVMGKALATNGRTAVHLGVTPAKAPMISEDKLAEEALEPHHSHFLLLDGFQWQQTVPPKFQIVNYFSLRAPVITLLINGEDISLQEIQACVRLGYKVIVFSGTGKLADEIATAIRYPEKPRRPEIAELIPRGRFLVYNISSSTAELKKLLSEQLIFEKHR